MSGTKSAKRDPSVTDQSGTPNTGLRQAPAAAHANTRTARAGTLSTPEPNGCCWSTPARITVSGYPASSVTGFAEGAPDRRLDDVRRGCSALGRPPVAVCSRAVAVAVHHNVQVTEVGPDNVLHSYRLAEHVAVISSETQEVVYLPLHSVEHLPEEELAALRASGEPAWFTAEQVRDDLRSLYERVAPTDRPAVERAIKMVDWTCAQRTGLGVAIVPPPAADPS